MYILLLLLSYPSLILIDDTGLPFRESNSMVEEFMLLANISVAQKICEEFPDAAVLHRHLAPPAFNFDLLLIAAQTKVCCYKFKIQFSGIILNIFL